MSNKYEWIEDFLIESFSDKGVIVDYYGRIHLLLIEKEFHTYSNLLEKVNISVSNETMMIGLLRLSYVWKEQIPFWGDFLSKVINELDLRGHKSKELLYGLYK